MKLIALAQSCFASNGIDWVHESLEALLQRCEKFDLPAPLFPSTEDKEAQRGPAGCPGMQPYEKAYYDALWVKCTGGGPLTEFIAAKDAVTLFRSSGLPEHILKTIWITAMSGNSQMSINQFYKALRLVAAARCQLPLVEDTIYEYPRVLPVFTGYPHPVEPPLRKGSPLPKDEIPPPARNQSNDLSGAFSVLGTYGQPYAQHPPNANHFSPASMPSDVPLRPLAGKAGLNSQPAPTFEHPKTYADKPNSHPVLQPRSLPGDAYTPSDQSSPGHFEKFPSMGSPSPDPNWSSAMPARPAQSQQHEEESWGDFSSGTDPVPPAENASDASKLGLQQLGVLEPKFTVDTNVAARNSNMMSGLSTEVKVPAITQPSAPSISDKGTNTDDEDDWADFSTAGDTAATNTEISTPASKAKSDDWTEFSAPPPPGISPPKTPATGNLLSPAVATGNVGSAPGMKPSNANAISSLFDAFDGLSATSPSPDGAKGMNQIANVPVTCQRKRCVLAQKACCSHEVMPLTSVLCTYKSKRFHTLKQRSPMLVTQTPRCSRK